MSSPQLVQLLVQPGITETLDFLFRDNATAFPRPSLEDIFADHGANAPALAVDSCIEAKLLQPFGRRLGISSFGRRTVLLLEALHGGDIEHILRRLRRLTSGRETYELVREGMTTKFFKSLLDHPGFGRLYFCSPWINPSEREAASLRYACLQAQRRGRQCDVLVITRPPEMMPAGTEGGLQCFKDVGAKILFHPRLHSKLYIREPDANGGLSLAIVGSQNLTRSAHLELGIRVNNDSRMIDELIRYFMQLAAQSSDA